MGNAVATILLTLMGFGDVLAEPTPVLQHRYDPARARSWELMRHAVLVHDGISGRRLELLLPGWIWLDEPHCPPDLVLGPGGEAVVTSNAVPTLWRIDARTFAISVHPLVLDADRDKDVGFAAIVYSPDERAFLAYSEVQRSIWKIDPTLRTATRIRQAQRAGRSLSARCADRQ
jgi:hypothetical protein